MSKSFSQRLAETQRQSTEDLEALREARLEDGEEVGVIDQVLEERRAETEAYQQDLEDQHNSWSGG